MLQTIDIKKILPNPNNPRKDLGDLSELIESIRKNGILQNITVMENNCEEFPETFICLIGHRRLEAAKQVDFSMEIECNVLPELPVADQITIMLQENMQRNDLTVVEQVKAIQQCMDLGMDEAELSEKTGLSKKTIKKRSNLIKYSNYENALNNGLTLNDFARLEEIDDIKVADKILEESDPENINYEITSVLRDQKLKKRTKKIEDFLKTFAVPLPDDDNDYTRVTFFSAYCEDDNFNNFTPDPKIKYYYEPENFGQFVLLIDGAPEDEQEEEEQSQESLNREKLLEQFRTADDNRKNFMQEVYGARSLNFNDNIDISDCFRYVIKYYSDYADYEYYLLDIKKCPFIFPRDVLLATFIILNNSDDGIWPTLSYDNTYETSEIFSDLYEFLENINYPISDIERSLVDGTNPLFAKDDSEDAEE